MRRKRQDALRITALVEAIESLARGEPKSLGDLATHVFGWDFDRAYHAVEEAVALGLIAPNPKPRPYKPLAVQAVPRVPKEDAAPVRAEGWLAGKIHVTGDFDDPPEGSGS